MKFFKTALAVAAILCASAGSALAADNLTVTVGSGKTLACKDLATVCFNEHMVVDHLGNIIDPMPASGGTVGISGTLPAFAATPTFNIGTAPTITVSGAYPADVSATAQSLASTLNAAYTLTLANGQGVTTFAVTGLTASAATLTIEASDDAGTTWAAVNGIAPATGALFTTLTADQQFRVNSAGRTRLRLRVSTAGSGTITVASNISTATSAVALSSPIPAGTNNIGTVQPGNTANTTPWLTTETPATAGGLTNYVLEPAASDNHANIKNGAGQVYGIHVFNNQATINYGRLYNAATGFNGCASATNLIYEFQIPGNTTGAGFVVAVPEGLAFGTGISICVTSTFGQTSVASATASAISLNVLYK
jgi:hypothetical protein